MNIFMLRAEQTVKNWHDKELSDIILEYSNKFPIGLLQQNLEELQSVKDYIKEKKFKKFVEVGSDHGASLWMYSHLFCNKDAEIISIDYTGLDLLKAVIAEIDIRGFKTQLIVKHSHDDLIHIEDIDFLHIDGNHSIDGVVGDWNKYYPCVIDGGIIVIHDTLLHQGPIEVKLELERRGFVCNTYAGRITLSNDRHAPAGITLIEKQSGKKNYYLDLQGIWDNAKQKDV